MMGLRTTCASAFRAVLEGTPASATSVPRLPLSAKAMGQQPMRFFATEQVSRHESSATSIASSSSDAGYTASTSQLPGTTSSALEILRRTSTPSHGRWVLARLHSRNYLLHPRDILTVPNLKSLPRPGTLLSLNRILEMGTREHILRAPHPSTTVSASSNTASLVVRPSAASLPADVVRCDLTVLEHTKSPLETKLLKKRRKGYKKTIQHKQGWTRLRVGDIYVGGEF